MQKIAFFLKAAKNHGRNFPEGQVHTDKQTGHFRIYISRDRDIVFDYYIIIVTLIFHVSISYFTIHNIYLGINIQNVFYFIRNFSRPYVL